MLDVISMTAINAVLGTVGSGMANEAGKWAWETAGGLVRRTLGREAPAPLGSAQTLALAADIHRALAEDPERAREWHELIRVMPVPETVPSRPVTPPGPRFFMDHDAEMKALDKEARRRYGGTPRVAAVLGAAGMGTTALVQCYAARSEKLFPDGQGYVDLRGGSSREALDPSVALRRLLLELGVDAARMPPATEDRSSLFRRIAADRRLLVVLDHAHSAAQVRPLLVAAPGVLTVIVARGPLPGLDAVPVVVGPLPDKHAKALLAAVVSGPALAAAADLLPTVLAQCAGSPYALRAAAPRLLAPGRSGRPAHPGASAATEDPVTDAAERAYHTLEPRAARAYRLMALRPWHGFGVDAAAHTLQVSGDETADVLDVLVAAQLLEEPGHGRYRYRPEVRAHAERAAAEEDGIAACSAAVSRSVDWYLRFAVRARKSALRGGWTIGALYDELPAGRYENEGHALSALAAELGNLVEAVSAAAEFGLTDAVYQLVQALWPLQLKAGRNDELLPALRDGVRIAGLCDPLSRQAGRMHSLLGLALTELRRYEEAEPQFLAAATAEEAAGHLRGQASAVESLGLMRLRQWRFTEAYDGFERADRVLDGIAPDAEGVGDLPRARLLLERHRGRALAGMGRHGEAREWLTGALEGFRGTVGDPYNAARTLCDLAANELAAGRARAALDRADEAEPLLAADGAELHLRELAVLRARALSALERRAGD